MRNLMTMYIDYNVCFIYNYDIDGKMSRLEYIAKRF